ncbi:MAG: hypothetical protein ACOZNI_11840 [Myxococcota bacterium]
MISRFTGFLLALGWLEFWAGFVATVVGFVLGFGLLYALGGDCVEGVPPGSVADAIAFSGRVAASLGFDAGTARTAYARAVVTLQGLLSLLGIATIVALTMARLIFPKPR